MSRKNYIPILLGRPLSIPQIARLVRANPKDVADDIQHLLKSLKHTDYVAVITPSECRKCAFQFGPDKLRKPSKCPECLSTWLTDPEIRIDEKGRGN